MTVLPNQIPPESEPILATDGKRISHNYWLFLYNISLQVLGNQNSTSPSLSGQILSAVDIDAATTDDLYLKTRVSNLEQQVLPAPPVNADVNALLLAQSAQLPDAVPRAQPVQVITVGASPFVVTALFDGTYFVSGGTVSALTISRDGITFYAVGTASGSVPVSRLDQLSVTYSGLPTIVFFPR